MVARVKPPAPGALVVTFERIGEEPIRVEVPDGEKAITRATAMILMHGRLQAGDRLTVEPTE
jgi:translation initiation factor IF-1